MEDIYDKAVRIWLGRKIDKDPETIFNVKFETIYGGHCETCEYTSIGITYQTTKNRWSQDYEIQGIAPAEFVREVSKIIKEINSEIP